MKASTPPPRPYHHGNLREALLEVAERTLEAHGVAKLTLREISRELGVSHTSPRNHFADKRALLDALAQRGYERLGERLARVAKDRRKDFDARLIKLSRTHVAFALAHPALFGLMAEALYRADAPAELLAVSERAIAPVTEIFVEGQASGAVVPGDPLRLRMVGYAAMQGLITLSSNGTFKGASLETLVDEVTERIILGLRPRL